MTSVSQKPQIPSQAASNTSSASQSAQSYASATKKTVSSPPIATGSSTPSPAVAVGGAAPVQHAKSSSISPVNGRSAITPVVPAVSTPAVAQGTTAANGNSTIHSRKSSMTISANGSYIPNGGPVGGQKAGIQFGSITDSPAATHSTPAIAPSTASAPISIPSNPRVTSPAQSPSPIPQPKGGSGGRPPSGLGAQNGGMTFGSLGNDNDRFPRQVSNPQVPLTIGNQPSHSRRESSGESTRGGYGGQGRGGRPFPQQPQFTQQQPMGYPPQSNPTYRGQPPRGGMTSNFQNPGRPMQYPNSPHPPNRSPNLPGSIPGTPNMAQAMPMPSPQPYPGYPQYNMGQQASHLSTLNNPSNSFKSGKKVNGGKQQQVNQQRLPFEPCDQISRPGPLSKELFGHSYTGHLMSNEQKPSERSERGQTSELIFLMPPPVQLPPLPSGASKKIDLSPESGNFERFLTHHPQAYQQYNPQAHTYDRMTGMPVQPYMQYPGMQYMQGMPGPPQSPQPGYQQPYSIGQYSNQPQPQAQQMSRNSSQRSERPNSSLGGPPQTPSTAPASHPPQSKQIPAPSVIQRNPRKSAAIVIKNPEGLVIQLPTAKPPASPAPSSNQSKTPPIISSTPTPPPKSLTPQHVRTDSAVVKDPEQVKQEFRELIEKAAAETESKAAESKVSEEELAAETKLREEAKAKAEAKAAEDAKASEEAAAKAAEEKRKQEEEEDLERQIREMEEAEELREKQEAELLAKRATERVAFEKANAEKNRLLAEENDRLLREQEREMERLEDERERKRQEAELAATGGDAKVKATAEVDAKKDAEALAEEVEAENKEAAAEESSDAKDAPATPNTLASKLSNLSLGAKGGDSGASTPGSDDSMGPPPSKISRGKPAALILAPLHTKPIEPPQPSAALQSLKSARFLTVLNPSLYPPNISSPNPALNSAVTVKNKNFKYDKEFLLQFQKVFTEKPSMEFESQIKALIGDGEGGSARPGSSRTPGGMGTRQNSNRNPPGAFVMGSFGATIGGGKTLPPGTTSAERFAISQGTLPRPNVNPMASFNRPGGAGFPSSNPMTRTPSTSNMGSIGPHSPRQQNRSQRNGSKRDNYKGSKQEAQAAAAMPLTAGMDVKPIQVTASGWKPRSVAAQTSATGAAGPTPGSSGSGHMDPDMVQRKVKAALNKMTPEKFDKIADQILTIAAQSKDEADGRTLRQVIQLTFEKATDEAHWASMYAKFCKRMLETMSPDIKDESILDKNGNVVSGGNLFRKYLLNRCQEEFERGWKTDLGEKPEGEEGDEKTGEAAMLSDAYYIAAAAKRRGLGLVQFIGELYKLGMLTERIMHECVKKLVDYTGIPDEAEIESLTKLLKTIGGNLDSTEKGRPMMDVYFTRIQAMIDTPDLPSRLKFMLMDIVDLRKKNWHSKEDNKGPKTLEEVRAEAEAAAAQKAAENARGNQRGSGGRMPMGRGDSRNFSGNQYGNQPPIDYTKNTVATDDLRRLGAKGARQAGGNMPSFGPTSMFSSRSNSGRKMGPGGSLSRTGEDSGASSRTGTPPQQKEKESTTSTNAFSLLADHANEEPENPASPPSVAASPAFEKAGVASQASDDKKDSDS